MTGDLLKRETRIDVEPAAGSVGSHVRPIKSQEACVGAYPDDPRLAKRIGVLAPQVAHNLVVMCVRVQVQPDRYSIQTNRFGVKRRGPKVPLVSCRERSHRLRAIRWRSVVVQERCPALVIKLEVSLVRGVDKFPRPE